MVEELVVNGLEHLRINTPGMPGHTDNAMPDYCSVFEGPYFNSSLSAIATPSLNAMFHFTFLYIVLAVGINPYKPAGGIAFSILLGIMAIANLSYRYILMCDDFKSIAIGLVFGATLGGLWFALLNLLIQNGCFMVMKNNPKM